MSLNVKPTGQVPAAATGDPRALWVVAVGTALVLGTYVTPMANIPATAADLGAGPVARAWILSSMSVGLAAALLASGAVGDRLGRRRTYVAGLSALTVGAVLAAVAQEPIGFVAARVLEGAGGAAVLACGLGILAHSHAPGPARMRAMAVWGASVGLGIVAGAVLAAALDVGTGWRESYAATAVIGLLLVLPSRRLPESSHPHAHRIDLPGVLLLVAGMTLLVSALTQGRNGVDGLTVVLAVLAVASLVAFRLVEGRVAAPLLDPELLSHPRFRAATIGSFVLGAGMIGMASFVPTVVQLGLGSGLWTASLLVVAWAGTSVVTALLFPRLRHPLEGPLPVALLLVVVAAGQSLAYGLSPSSSPVRLVAPLVVAGLATGVLNALLGREAIASVPPERAAMGSGANNTARYLGAACGITVFVVVATHAGGGLAPAQLVDGWNVAVLVSVAMTLVGALAIAAGRLARSR